MDFFNDPAHVVAFTSLVLALILDANESFAVIEDASARDARQSSDPFRLNFDESPVMDTLSLASATLHYFRLSLVPYPMTDEVVWWVKPRSTTWFSRFLLEQYDNSRWLSMFRMTKESVFSLVDLLNHMLRK